MIIFFYSNMSQEEAPFCFNIMCVVGLRVAELAG